MVASRLMPMDAAACRLAECASMADMTPCIRLMVSPPWIVTWHTMSIPSQRPSRKERHSPKFAIQLETMSSRASLMAELSLIQQRQVTRMQHRVRSSTVLISFSTTPDASVLSAIRKCSSVQNPAIHLHQSTTAAAKSSSPKAARRAQKAKATRVAYQSPERSSSKPSRLSNASLEHVNVFLKPRRMAAKSVRWVVLHSMRPSHEPCTRL
mmetsp:Transcript_78378/g.181842  ORF Transcript_78378/g.181842 Transcript_78378/m.181842 type:complete len:210 (-) Transcript_78378:283-912(-)